MCKTIVLDFKNIELLLKSRNYIRLSAPYESFNGKIGVQIKYLFSDKNKSICSLNLITYNALNRRINSKTMCEKRLRRASKLHCALVEYNSLDKEWRTAIIEKFGNPIELC